MYGSDDILIASYGELNAHDCGRNGFSSQIYSQCYRWHRESVPQVRDGRNATVGEVPGIVRLGLYWENEVQYFQSV